MKATSILNVMDSLLKDCSNRFNRFSERDSRYIANRLKHEGVSFVTITLTDFAESFFLALEHGSVDSSSFTGWRKTKCLPSFLKGFTSRVFDIRTGVLLDDPDVQAIKSIRQICLVFKKVNMPCSDKKVQNALKKFTAIDDDLSTYAPSSRSFDMFVRVSKIVVSSLFPQQINASDLIPKHGPGSTQEKVFGNQKFDPSNYSVSKTFERNFPLGEFFFNSEESYLNFDKEVKISVQSEPVRVVPVPKTLKTPRIIALEPVAKQYMQQALKSLVVDEIERNPLTLGHVNFTDQSINRELALKNSITGQFATLDVTAASDSVHKFLVRKMLLANPSLARLVFLTRSTKASVEGKVIKLNKFASMGSALCFPMEALAFFILCITSRLLRQRNSQTHISYADVFTASRDIYIYGDDIIIPVDEVEAAVNLLAEFKLKISIPKSFYKGKFRESCGMDAYNGEDVTPTYIRQKFPSCKKNAKGLISFVETANQFYKKGYVNTFNTLKVCVEKILGKLPSISEDSSGIGWIAPGYVGKLRYNTDRQDFDVKTYVPKTLSLIHI